MSYKVNYYTLAKLPEGKIGNIKQNDGHFYTDSKIEEIPIVLNKYLEEKNKVGVILKIEDVGGNVL